MTHLVIAPLALSLVIGAVLVLAPGSQTRGRRMLSVLGTLGLMGLALMLLARTAQGEVLVYNLGDWPAPYGIVLVADRLAAGLVMITATLALAVLAYAVRGGDRAGRQFHSLFHFQLFGLNGAFLTGDLFNLFVFFEVLLIASYGLLLHGGGRERTRAGLHYVVLNLIGSALFLFAVGTLYGVLGTLNIADLAVRVAALPPADEGVVRAAALLLLVVFGLKAALAPLHFWLPGAYGHASAPVAALFAIMTKVGAYSIVRVYSLVFGATSGSLAGIIEPWLLPLGLITILVGAMGALSSRRLAQQAAHLVVASAGTMMIAFGLGSAAAVAAGLYYLAHSTFSAAALFLFADLLVRARGPVADSLTAGPALPQRPLLGGLFFVVALTVAGMPPLSGFVGKFLILQSSLGGQWSTWVLAVVLLSSLIIIIALARSGSRLFFETDTSTKPTQPLNTADLCPVVALAAIGGALVLAAGPVYEFAQATAEQLVRPTAYLEAVLANPVASQQP